MWKQRKLLILQNVKFNYRMHFSKRLDYDKYIFGFN